MNRLVPVLLSSIFAAGCASVCPPSAGPTAPTEPLKPDSEMQASVELYPPFTSLSSVIRMRALGSKKDGVFLEVKAVIGQDSKGENWGCSKIYDEASETVLTPSEYEHHLSQTPGKIAGLASLHGRDCAPVDVNQPTSAAMDSTGDPSGPSSLESPDPTQLKPVLPASELPKISL